MTRDEEYTKYVDRPVIILPTLYYLQSFGSENYTFDKAYTHGLFRMPQPANLDKHETEQALLDYKESSNITSTEETEVISNFEFILKELRSRKTIIQGPFECGFQLRIRGDGTNTTYLTKLRFSLYKRTEAGVDTAIIEDAEYAFDTPVSHQANDWDDKVGVKLHEDISLTVLPADERLVGSVDVLGYVSDAAASNNKIRLYFSRGSIAESYIYLPIEDEGY
ncbi:hypothetical protein DRN97_06240 [Methanosarcinales archaeon]|nr:MAG: hypothetical protein DRN97_06240 [Methanosarcinales archaeon]